MERGSAGARNTEGREQSDKPTASKAIAKKSIVCNSVAKLENRKAAGADQNVNYFIIYGRWNAYVP